MKVIIEESLFINFFIIFCILKLTAFITHQKIKLIYLNSLFGALIALISPIINNLLIKYLLLFFTISLINISSFNFINLKRLFINYLIILIFTFTLGGGCLALENMVGKYPLFIVSVVGLVLSLLIGLVIKFINHNNSLKKFTYKIVFKDGEKVVEEEGYLDSGNVLYDNITNKPIVLVTFDVFSKFYSNVSYFDAVLKNIDSSSIKNAHYIKINSIGKGTSMLVFSVDELSIEDRYYKNVSLGLSFSGFEKSFGKNVLLHCDYV